MGCTGYRISSQLVREARGRAISVLLLHDQLQLIVQDWIDRLEQRPWVDSAVIAERVRESIRPEVVDGLITLARIRGNGGPSLDLLRVAQAAEDPAAMLCACVRNHVRECVSQERKRFHRQQAVLQSRARIGIISPPLSEADRLELLEALEKLDEDDKLAVRLYYFADWSQEQIAEKSQISRATVQRRIRRGQARLKELLSGAR